MIEEGPASALGVAASYASGGLLGSTATALAILAVAGFGMVMLTGRLERRRGLQIILGCFVLFTARTIASELLGITDQAAVRPDAAASVPETPPAIQVSPPRYDPYAGAAVPTRGEELPGSAPFR